MSGFWVPHVIIVLQTDPLTSLCRMKMLIVQQLGPNLQLAAPELNLQPHGLHCVVTKLESCKPYTRFTARTAAPKPLTLNPKL